MRKTLEDLEVIIIDEMSMVSADKFYEVHRRLQEIFISNDLFGGKAIMLVGDLLQLPPVKGTAIYSEPYNSKSSLLWRSSDNLWQSCDVVILETNHRQGKGNPWTQCLNRIRVGEPTEEDFKLLESRQIKLSKKQYKEAKHVFYQNIHVNNYNTKMLDSLDSDLITIQADCSGPKGYYPITNAKGEVADTPFMKTLHLKVGARIVLTFNVNTSDCLVNGVMGTIIDFIFLQTDVVKAIIVAFDDDEVGQMQISNHQNDSSQYSQQRGCPIYRQSLEYNIPYKSSSRTHGSKCKVTQFPLRLAWASTAHKMQGVTVKKGLDLVVHGTAPSSDTKRTVQMPRSMYYVMFSRAQSIDNVFVDENFDASQVKAHEASLEENFALNQRSIVSMYENQHLYIYMVNIRSLNKHFKDLEKDMFAKSANNICLVETWIDKQCPKSCFEMEGRVFEHSSWGRGKGCAMFSMPLTSSKVAKKIAQEKFQLLSKVIGLCQLTLLYITSDCSLDGVVDTLQHTMISNMSQIVIGDFNFNASEANILTKYLQNQNLVQIVQEPTHIAGRILDQCYISRDIEEKLRLTIQSPYFTDHNSLCIEMLDC